MGPEVDSRNGKRKVRELCGPEWRKTIYSYDNLGLSPSEYDETQVSARRTGVTSLNIQGMGANLGNRACCICASLQHPHSKFRIRQGLVVRRCGFQQGSG